MKFKLTLSQKNFSSYGISEKFPIWNQLGYVIFEKKYDRQQLNFAVNEVIRTNDSLKIKIPQTSEESVAELFDFNYTEFPFLFFDSKLKLSEFTEKFVNEAIDLTTQLYRFVLFQMPEGSGIIFCAHHIISDGFSLHPFTAQLQHFLENCTEEFGAVDTYADYVNSEEKYRSGKRYPRDKQFWKEQFAQKTICSIIPQDKTNLDYYSAEKNIKISHTIFSKINEFCNEHDISVQAYINTVYGVYFSRKYNENNFTVGIPVLNRTTAAELNTVGLYMHILPLILDITADSFIENAKKVENSQLTLYRHQKFTQQDIKDMLKEQGKYANSLFDIVCDYQELPANDNYTLHLQYSNALSLPLEIHLQTSAETEHNLKIRYKTAIFKENEINEMTASIVNIMTYAVEHPNDNVFKIPLCSEKMLHKLLYDFNNTLHSYNIPNNSTLYSLFEKTAKENPEKVCLVMAEREMTFGELLSIAESLDSEIQKITKGEKCVIPVIAQRSVEMYAAIYGIIRGGNAYLPIADDYPQDRIDYIIENSAAAVAVTQGKYTSLVKNIPCIDMTGFIANYKKTDNILPSAAKENDTAYVIYTSGSTGNPKGAKVSHKSAVNRILWMHDMYPLEENGVILQKTPYTFDVSVWELFWWGIVGGKLAASKPLEHFLPARILDEVYTNKVTHLHFVPSVFELFLNYLEAHKDEVQKFDSVRYVFLSGEALSAELITRFYALYDYGKVSLHNLYGPTECAVDVTYYPCKPDDTNPVPIGKPIYNTQIHIVDKYMNLQPIGVKGELCIGGVNVGQGYLNNKQMTNEKFIDNPFGEGKLYKTGDLAYWREDGEVIFCGRIDSQIKLNGQRIEISEIEAVINSMPQVDAVAVVVSKVRSPEMLVAFYCSEEDIAEDIRELCLRKLPGYMVPAVFVQIDKLPLNQSGKLDRKLLSQRKVDFVNLQSDNTPKTANEQMICDLFVKILNTDNIGRNSNFFENGGTSLSMISALSEKLLENITAAQFMQNPTPLKLAELIESEKQSALEYLEPLYVAPDAKKAFVLLPFAGGGAEVYAAFTEEIKKQSEAISVYFIRYLHSIDDCKKAAAEISDILGKSEIYLYSHCVGSALALHILSALEKKGKTVKHYFAAASIPPVKPTRRNIWNIVPDFVLKKILLSAGASIDLLSADKQTAMLKSFRKDTDFANIAFAEFDGRIKTPVSVIISKTDIFTKNYKKAKQLWENYAEKINGVYFFLSDSHYFQSENSSRLVQIILSIK